MHRLYQRQEAQIEAQHVVFGMVDDPGHLVGMQPWVERVQHPARAADAVIQLQVAVAVPGDGADAAGGRDTGRVQRVGDLPRAAGDFGPAGPVDVALHPSRDDLAVSVMPLGKHDQA